MTDKPAKKAAAKRPGRRPGPAPLPVEQHRARGNPSKKALPKNTAPIEQVSEIPEPPRPLGTEGRALWDRAWGAGRRWLSADGDADILLLLCEAMDERVTLRETVLAEGDWRQRTALRALDKQIIDKLQLLGFTPSDRGRLGVAEVKSKSELEEYRERTRGA